LRFSRERIATRRERSSCTKAIEKAVGHRFDDDEALGGDAALAAVHEARVRGGAGGRGEIGIGQKR